LAEKRADCSAEKMVAHMAVTLERSWAARKAEKKVDLLVIQMAEEKAD
jgi:hypothetical protein